ncbi:DUF502 domain-containing protein [bacterium]|nr:DUF502 domain-containing protein [bacterium]
MTPQVPIKKSISSRFRKAFFTGLLVVAPLWLTIYVIILAVRLLGGVLSPYVRLAAETIFELEKMPKLVGILSDLVAFILTVILIALIGVIVRRVVGKKIFEWLDKLLTHIPVVRDIYDGVRKFIQVFFGDQKKFKGVVAVRFPTHESLSVGFVTGESTMIPNEGKRIHVFVPTAPNPTSGFLYLLRESEVIPLDITVDEAVKLIISGGAIVPERHTPS